MVATTGGEMLNKIKMRLPALEMQGASTKQTVA